MGADLGQRCFQFQFASEKDSLKVLEYRPYHFAHWMILLQRWEPTTATTFPNLTSFWIQVQGIPLHLWSDVALTFLAKDIRILEKIEIYATKARIRVLINGLNPLIKKATLNFDSGEEVEVTLVYEKLEKHCTTCCMLDHEAQDCPERETTNTQSQYPTRTTSHHTRPYRETERQGAHSESRSRPDSRSNMRDQRDHPMNFHVADSDRRLIRSNAYHPDQSIKTFVPHQDRNSNLPYSSLPRKEYANYYSPRELEAATSYHSREYRRLQILLDIYLSLLKGQSQTYKFGSRNQCCIGRVPMLLDNMNAQLPQGPHYHLLQFLISRLKPSMKL